MQITSTQAAAALPYHHTTFRLLSIRLRLSRPMETYCVLYPSPDARHIRHRHLHFVWSPPSPHGHQKAPACPIPPRTPIPPYHPLVALNATFPGPPLRAKQMTVALKDQEEYTLGSLTVKALHTPCHTRGHVLFFVTSSASTAAEEGAAPLVFSGDTLFVGGCGRFFEGDASQSKSSPSWRRGLEGTESKLASAFSRVCVPAGVGVLVGGWPC